MVKVDKMGKPNILILFFTLFGLSVLIFLLFLFLGREKINIEIVEFKNITNQTLLEELFRSYNLDFYPLYAESYTIEYGIGNNKTKWYRAYINIFAFDDSNKTNNFFEFSKNYRKGTGNFSIFLLKNNRVMIINFYEERYINYVIEKFKIE